MTVKLLAKQHLEFLSLEGAAQAHMNLHLSKCNIAAHMCFKEAFMHMR